MQDDQLTPAHEYTAPYALIWHNNDNAESDNYPNVVSCESPDAGRKAAEHLLKKKATLQVYLLHIEQVFEIKTEIKIRQIAKPNGLH